MASIRSRAYKLQLSSEGMQLFLRCHDRLCRTTGDLLPYGATLYVAVAMMGRAATKEIADALLDPELNRLGGRTIRYVGTSPRLAEKVGAIAERVIALEVIHPAPQIWKLLVTSLTFMEDARREALIAGLAAMREEKAGETEVAEM